MSDLFSAEDEEEYEKTIQAMIDSIDDTFNLLEKEISEMIAEIERALASD